MALKKFKQIEGQLVYKQIFGGDPGSPPPLSEFMLFAPDSTRDNKLLSIETTSFFLQRSTVGTSAFLRIGNVTDNNLGFIMPFDGVVVRSTAFTVTAAGNTRNLELYINGGIAGTLGTLSGAAAAQYTNNDLDINFQADDKLRVAGDGAAGILGDTVVVFWVKWRG